MDRTIARATTTALLAALSMGCSMSMEQAHEEAARMCRTTAWAFYASDQVYHPCLDALSPGEKHDLGCGPLPPERLARCVNINTAIIYDNSQAAAYEARQRAAHALQNAGQGFQQGMQSNPSVHCTSSTIGTQTYTTCR
jgi:hypothetical protein